MYRKDNLTVQRRTYELIKGNVTYKDLITVCENIPCHLSVSLNNTLRDKDVPYLNSEFTLFLNFSREFSIKENDILLITTAKNQNYTLYAGEIKLYGHSVQIKCRQEKIIESDET